MIARARTEKPIPHLQTGHPAGLVCVSPVDLGGLSVPGRQGVRDDDLVLGRDHAAVPGHRDGRQHVVSCRDTQIHIMGEQLYFWISLTTFKKEKRTTNVKGR